jgi:NUMOD4 motif/HNH endonuclease
MTEPFRIYSGWDARQAEAAEVWRPVVGFPDYEVSDHGRGRSLPRVVPGHRGVRRLIGKILRASCIPGKYSTVGLRKESTSSHTIAIHSAVLRAFVGSPSLGQEGAHHDGNMRNNRLDNLRWAYPKQNHADRLHQGRPMARNLNLSVEQVRDIRRKAQFGRQDGARPSGNITALAEEYGVDRQCIFRIATRRTYAWVSDV